MQSLKKFKNSLGQLNNIIAFAEPTQNKAEREIRDLNKKINLKELELKRKKESLKKAKSVILKLENMLIDDNKLEAYAKKLGRIDGQTETKILENIDTLKKVAHDKIIDLIKKQEGTITKSTSVTDKDGKLRWERGLQEVVTNLEDDLVELRNKLEDKLAENIKIKEKNKTNDVKFPYTKETFAEIINGRILLLKNTYGEDTRITKIEDALNKYLAGKEDGSKIPKENYASYKDATENLEAILKEEKKVKIAEEKAKKIAEPKRLEKEAEVKQVEEMDVTGQFLAGKTIETTKDKDGKVVSTEIVEISPEMFAEKLVIENDWLDPEDIKNIITKFNLTKPEERKMAIEAIKAVRRSLPEKRDQASARGILHNENTRMAKEEMITNITSDGFKKDSTPDYVKRVAKKSLTELNKGEDAYKAKEAIIEEAKEVAINTLVARGTIENTARKTVNALVEKEKAKLNKMPIEEVEKYSLNLEGDTAGKKEEIEAEKARRIEIAERKGDGTKREISQERKDQIGQNVEAEYKSKHGKFVTEAIRAREDVKVEDRKAEEEKQLAKRRYQFYRHIQNKLGVNVSANILEKLYRNMKTPEGFDKYGGKEMAEKWIKEEQVASDKKMEEKGFVKIGDGQAEPDKINLSAIKYWEEKFKLTPEQKKILTKLAIDAGGTGKEAVIKKLNFMAEANIDPQKHKGLVAPTINKYLGGIANLMVPALIQQDAINKISQGVRSVDQALENAKEQDKAVRGLLARAGEQLPPDKVVIVKNKALSTDYPQAEALFKQLLTERVQEKITKEQKASEDIDTEKPLQETEQLA